jgi:LemA protein
MDLDKIEIKKEKDMSDNVDNPIVGAFKKFGKWILLIIIGFGIWGSFNGLTKADIATEDAWGGVETSYQSRADKVKNLTAIVKGAADFEQGTLTDVIEARAKATSVTIDPSNLTPEKMAEFEAAQGQLTGALSKLLVTVERYPELKAVAAFRDFQAQYEGIENRIQKSRDDYNGTVKTYNTKIRKFPSNLFNLAFGFEKKEFFKAQAGSEDAPDIEF